MGRRHRAALAAGTLLIGLWGLARDRDRMRPWLTVLFGINARYGDVSPDTLRNVEPVDVTLLALSGVAYAGFGPGPAPHTCCG